MRQRVPHKGASGKPPRYPENKESKSSSGKNSRSLEIVILLALVLSVIGFSIAYIYSRPRIPVISKLPNASLENSYDKVFRLLFPIYEPLFSVCLGFLQTSTLLRTTS